jgi:hypothetical protein
MDMDVTYCEESPLLVDFWLKMVNITVNNPNIRLHNIVSSRTPGKLINPPPWYGTDNENVSTTATNKTNQRAIRHHLFCIVEVKKANQKPTTSKVTATISSGSMKLAL